MITLQEITDASSNSLLKKTNSRRDAAAAAVLARCLAGRSDTPDSIDSFSPSETQRCDW